MSWLISLGLIFGIIGAGLFRIPTAPWYRIQRTVYRLSPRVKHYQNIESVFNFITKVPLNNQFVIFSQTTENDLPHDISETTARILYGVMNSTDFYSPSDEEDELQSVIIRNGEFTFLFDNDPNYHIPFDEGINRFRIAKDGFLDEYYTGKGAIFLLVGFLLQLVGTFPLF